MALNELDDLYREVILDHSRNTRNPENLDTPDIIADGVNPFCGDEIHLQITLDENDKISEVGFSGEGCAINQATGSMLSEAIKGKTLDEVERISDLFRDVMRGHEPTADEQDTLGDLESLSSVRQFPVRIKCALLAWSALEDGIKDFLNSNTDSAK